MNVNYYGPFGRENARSYSLNESKLNHYGITLRYRRMWKRQYEWKTFSMRHSFKGVSTHISKADG